MSLFSLNLEVPSQNWKSRF